MKKKLLLITLIILIIIMYYKNYFLEIEEFNTPSIADISNNIGSVTNSLEDPKTNLNTVVDVTLPMITDSINKML